MRTLVRWSDSSLSITTPRPEKAEPSRCITRSVIGRLLGLGLEITVVDRLEAGILDTEVLEPALHGDNFHSRFRSHITISVKAQFADAGLLYSADARDECKPFSQPSTVGFNIDNITATKNLTT